MERRKFLGLLGTAAAGAVLAKPAQAAGNSHFEGYPHSSGVLFDATRCIGCRRCEAGCNQVNGLPAPPERRELEGERASARGQPAFAGGARQEDRTCRCRKPTTR